MRIDHRSLVALVASVMSCTVAQAQSNTNQIMGTLGHPVGTELTIEGTFNGGYKKNMVILVTKVNGSQLVSPKGIEVGSFPGFREVFEKITTNTTCRFKGLEETFVETEKAKEAQRPPGRHFWFKVTEVLAPDGVHITKDKIE